MRNRNVVIVGLAAGLLSGIFGVGGGVLIVPGLMLVAQMEQRRAHGTSLAAAIAFGMLDFAFLALLLAALIVRRHTVSRTARSQPVTPASGHGGLLQGEAAEQACAA